MRRAALFTAIVMIFCLAAADAMASWTGDQDQAQSLARAGDQAGAADTVARAVKTAMAELDASDPRLHELLIQAGRLHIQAGRKAAARRYLQYARIQLEKAGETGQGQLQEVKGLLARAQGPDEAPPPLPTPPAPKAAAPSPPAPGVSAGSPSPAVEITAMRISEYGLYQTGEIEPESEFASRQTYSDADMPGQGKAGRVTETKLLETTDQVPNRPDTTFGVKVLVDGWPEGSEAPVVIKLSSPPRVVDDRGNRVSIEEFDANVVLGQGIWYGHTMPDHPLGRPAGEWIIQVWAGGRKMAEQVFHLGPPE